MDRMAHIVLGGGWCNIIVLNVRAPSEKKTNNSKPSFYEELEQAFYHFPKHHIKILVGNFSKSRGEGIFSTQHWE
jgi:hypothetical protein